MKFAKTALAALCALCAAGAAQAELDDVQKAGELRHLGINYANFVTASGKNGLDVELMQGFAKKLGVRYAFAETNFYNVLRDLLGKDVKKSGDEVVSEGQFPVKGDVISTGFTKLPWREKVVLYSAPVFPSQVLLVARSDSPLAPVKATGDMQADIAASKALIGKNSLLAMERTCLDPSSYGLKNAGIDLRLHTKSTNLNEMVPTLLNKEVDLTLLDIPDAILDLQKYSGKIKVLGPISGHQELATAFDKNSPKLREAFNDYFAGIVSDGTWDKMLSKYYPGIKRQFPEFFASQAQWAKERLAKSAQGAK